MKRSTRKRNVGRVWRVGLHAAACGLASLPFGGCSREHYRVNADKAAGTGDKAPDLVPASWQLMRVTPSGRSEAIAKGVLTFDVNPGGLLIYSNGTGIFTICDGKPVRILVDRMIEQVALL